MKLHPIAAALVAGAMAATLPALASAAESAPSPPATEHAAHPSHKQEVRITRVTPEYWRITMDNPPYNIFGPETIPQLNDAITQIETDPRVKVVVFDSAVPGFFLTHYNFVPPLSDTTSMAPGRTGLPPLPDMLARLSRAPVVSIALIRGRATGVGSELALASDMRFASREKAVLSQFEIGAGFTPGGGPMARLPRLIGRGRALEVLLSGDDINGELAERYGYVNRAFPDAELDGFVDNLARRISRFDKQTLADIKQRVDIVSLPPDKELGGEWDSFITSVQRPQAQARIQQLMKLGLQTKPDVEVNLPHYTGLLDDPAK
ncbi:enoyl-CoA hydratase/isomerase family protein [Dyella soli]|uniref:Enoyl-CoA hydratase/isomerase family protein n=1 Tax=Dyella soli TaxID=522319 RepID=A0A4R0YMR6_9GAMM|nr:enoyl-CoA hydratase/isomerase family protein [Dyella soli]TCI10189.1 enoyl-CoA hydratase/isomerase family protein [Dyella soli]